MLVRMATHTPPNTPAPVPARNAATGVGRGPAHNPGRAAPTSFPYRHRTVAQADAGLGRCPACRALREHPCSYFMCPLVTDPVDKAVRRAWARNQPARKQRKGKPYGASVLERAMQREVEKLDR